MSNTNDAVVIRWDSFKVIGLRTVAARAMVLAAVALCGGCGVDWAYLLPAAAGQFRLIADSVPIDTAIEHGQLGDDQVAKLRLIQDARLHARDAMGLSVKDNFTKFYDSKGQAVAFNVSASRKDKLEPREWWFPIVGTVPYLGYFDRAAADAKVAWLADEGLDVFMYEIEAYSGIGFIPNLVLSPLLKRSEISIAQTVFHELLHSTVWHGDNTSFNESLASFYGRRGAISYLTETYPDQPEKVQEAMEQFEDVDRYTESMLVLFDDLEVLYASDVSAEEKIAAREAVYQAGRERFAAEVQPLMNSPGRYNWVQDIPANNAWMLGIRRYHLDLDTFERVFAATGEDWSAMLAVVREAARHSDPYAYLREWLTAR